MTKNLYGSVSSTANACNPAARNADLYGKSNLLRRSSLTLAIAACAMMAPDIFFGSHSNVHATDENSLGDEVRISDTDGTTTVPLLPDIADMNSNNQVCEIVVISPGTMGASIENKVLSSKLIGGRAGTAHINATNSSYTLSLDNPVGFTSMPVGGNSGVVMSASFSGNGDTNFSETPGNFDIRLKRGLTVVQAHLTAERTDGDPFPAGYYSAQLTMRCE